MKSSRMEALLLSRTLDRGLFYISGFERERAEEGQRSAVGVLKQTLELYKEQPRPSGAEPR